MRHRNVLRYRRLIILLKISFKPETLGFTAIASRTLFNVTNASIIDLDFSNQSADCSSTNYKTLRYQALFYASGTSVNLFIVCTL